MHNDANRTAWSLTWGSIPSRISVVELTGKYKEYPFTLALRRDKLGTATPLTPGYLEYFSAMNKATKDIAWGRPGAAAGAGSERDRRTAFQLQKVESGLPPGCGMDHHGRLPRQETVLPTRQSDRRTRSERRSLLASALW